MNVLLLKTAFILACIAALSAALFINKRLRPASHVRFRSFDIPLLWFCTRLLPFIAVYFVAGFSTESDVATCFWPQAAGALAGQVPYRDFESFFSPFFPHLLSVPLLAWKDPRALILWLTLLEAATIALTCSAAGLYQAGPRRTRYLLFCYLAPGPLLLSVIGGQEDFLVWSFGLLVWLAFSSSRTVLASTATAAAMLFTKALFLLPLAGFLGMAGSARKYLSVIVPVGALAALILWHLTGTAFLSFLGQSGNISPPQIWILLHFLTNGLITAGTPAISFCVIALLLVGALWAGRWRRTEIKQSWIVFAGGWTVLFTLLMILSPKSQGAYLGNFALPCLVLALEHPRFLIAWTGLGALAVIEPSVFYRFGEQIPAGLDGIKSVPVAVDLFLQVIMVFLLIWIARRAWRIFSEPKAVV